MPRPKRTFKDPKEAKKHEERLKKRRAAHARVRSLQMAAEAAPEDVDFAKLVEAEKARMSTPQQTAGRKGGAASPKVTAKARDDMALAFDLMGGVPALVVWGRANPTEFYRLWARLIPKPAEEASSAMPLEKLLEKLATREEMSVRDAALDIGEELIELGRKKAEEEDWEATRPRGSTVQ